ncbi:MAG TPA: hypothetical protein VL527_05320, partial [Dongiaceae bacterium]|nr:hypothetical protein [Dongiaceae bacterium]
NFNLTLALQIAGLLHLGLMAAGMLMPRVVQLRSHLVGLPPFIRQLFWVYYSFIGLCLVSFCVITLAFAGPLASGTPLARVFCGFFAAFWTLRLFAATFILNVQPYLTNRWRTIGYHATNIAFAYLPVVYVWGAWHGSTP